MARVGRWSRYCTKYYTATNVGASREFSHALRSQRVAVDRQQLVMSPAWPVYAYSRTVRGLYAVSMAARILAPNYTSLYLFTHGVRCGSSRVYLL